MQTSPSLLSADFANLIPDLEMISGDEGREPGMHQAA